MNQGFQTEKPVLLDPASELERDRVKNNYTVLLEILRAARFGDAELVKRLANLIEVRPLAD